MPAPISPLRLVTASLRHYAPIHAAVVLAVAVAAAVLGGALVVGDSMRESLRELALERLGRIDQALLADRFFPVRVAEELDALARREGLAAEAVPAIVLAVSVRTPDAAGGATVNGVNLLGGDARFWALNAGGPRRPPQGDRIVLNAPLAEALGVGAGDAVMVALPHASAIPGASFLGRKTPPPPVRMVVEEVIAPSGLGRFDLRPSQQTPRNAYVSLEWLQQRLDRPGQVNAILVAGRDGGRGRDSARLVEQFCPSLEDCGIRLAQSPLGYFQLTSDRLLLEPAAEEMLLESLAPRRVRPVLIYLANTIAAGGREVPYSTIAAVDFDAAPLGPLAGNEVVLNRWAAEALGAKAGQTIDVAYFAPESLDGQPREQRASFKLKAVAELEGAAADPEFMPEVPGLTDKKTIARWDPPFPFDASRVGPADEEYWNRRRGTPKAFVSLAAGRRLWASRFGQSTALRVTPQPGETLDQFRGTIAVDPKRLGMSFQPLKQQALAAARGTTPFAALFLGFSSFLIVAALMLVGLLFRLGVELRAREIGILRAVGFPAGRVHRLLSAEGLAVAAVGAAIGVPLGLGYAALLVHALNTWWLDAIATPFLALHAAPLSLAIGAGGGLLAAWAAMLVTLRRMARRAPRGLLAGIVGDDVGKRGQSPFAGTALRVLRTNGDSPLFPTRKRARPTALVAAVCLAAALGLGLWGAMGAAPVRAGAFFGAGAAVLVAFLAASWAALRAGATGPAVAAGRGNLLRLALRNAARHPGRSALTVGLIAAASFLIIATSAFQLSAPPEPGGARDGPSGGFSLYAQSAQPIYADLQTKEGRAALDFTDPQQAAMEGTTVAALRAFGGDDASCRNLYRPRQPRILGVGADLIARDGFPRSGAGPLGHGQSNPWLLLRAPPAQDADGVWTIPVVLEENTALYALHLGGGVGHSIDVTDDRGRALRLKVVALLGQSLFQGDLLVSEENFVRFFPRHGGYRLFLIDAPPDKRAAVRRTLESALSGYGLTVEDTRDRLAALAAVQNTYLAAFQSLGGLGLLLGTLGLAAVQARSALERRGELALLRASGFRRRTLAALVLAENGVLLAGGLAAGVAAAMIAIGPHLLRGEAAVPWAWLGLTMLALVAAGLVAAHLAVGRALAAPLLPALRGD